MPLEEDVGYEETAAEVQEDAMDIEGDENIQEDYHDEDEDAQIEVVEEEENISFKSRYSVR